MEDLKTYYRGSLKNRVETLEAVRQALGKDDGEARESIRRIALSLKGTGETYGFPEISQAAEALLAAPRENLTAAMEALIETMRRVAEAPPEDIDGNSRDTPAEYATILLVEGDPRMLKLLEPKLAGPNRRIVTAGSGAEADKILAVNRVDLILVSLILPDEDGRNLLARLRDNPRYTATPVIVVSGREGTQPKAECYALGADEYFEQPVDFVALSAAVATKLLRTGEISREARLDPLTGMLNRAGVAIAFERAQALAQRAGYPLSLALADLDGLKRINDTHGHAAGDEVLRRVAAILTDSLRRSDRVARWGGDEFVILFPNSNPRGATRALEKVLHVIGEERFGLGKEEGLGESSPPLRVGFSAGVTGVGKGMQLDDAVVKADKLLYHAKAAGGRRILTSRRQPSVPKKRVLLADADAKTARLVEKQLAAADLEVVWCTEGRAAFETALDSDVDLAILDVTMPDMSGLEILERLRKTAVHAETPIILLTAADSEEEVLRAFDLGADDYVVKPFSQLELRARVCRLLKTAARRG